MVGSGAARGWFVAAVLVLVPTSASSDAPIAQERTIAAAPADADANVTAHAPVRLPAPAQVGQAARSEATIQTSVDGGPVTMSVTTSALVTNVTANGAYTAQATFESISVTNAPASANVKAWGFDQLIGTTFQRRFAATGAPLTGLTRSADARSVVLEPVAMAHVAFPPRPVSVGQSWSVPGQVSSEGLVFDVEYQCRLAAVTASTYAVDVSYAEAFSMPAADGHAEGTISGTATLSGSLVNPIIIDGVINQTIDGVITSDGTSTPMRRDTTISLTARGA